MQASTLVQLLLQASGVKEQCGLIQANSSLFDKHEGMAELAFSCHWPEPLTRADLRGLSRGERQAEREEVQSRRKECRQALAILLMWLKQQI